MSERYLGENIPKLGFGLMRLPTLDGTAGGEIDMEQLKTMVDRFLAAGFTYFDTAYVYGGGKSELAAKEALVKRHPRESYLFADKLPLWTVSSHEDLKELFETSLERTGLEYFDFYLLHALSAESYEKSEKFGAWDYIKEEKSNGRIKHIGFSFHDSPEMLDSILTAHPEAEFVQLQINYADWDNDVVQARRCYETARRHGKPVIIMEPVKGGSLANMRPQFKKYFEDANPNVSVASWAMRFAGSLDGVLTILSGMSSPAQMEDNIKTIGNFTPLTEGEREVIAEAMEEIGRFPTVPCTACRYCVENCPQKIDIPEVIRVLNDYQIYQNRFESGNAYGMVTEDGGKASACIRCGTCEGHCPQHIEIMDTLEKTAKIFEA